MNGYEVDVKALEQAIQDVLEPWINHAGLMWGKLNLLENGELPRISGRCLDTEIGRTLGTTNLGFAGRYGDIATGIAESAHMYVVALQAFRDTLQQVVDSYRTNELRQEDTFRRMLRDF